MNECKKIGKHFLQRTLTPAVGWKVVETKGNIGFDIQKGLLKRIKPMIPPGMKVMLAADRFYGTSSLISVCQDFGGSIESA